MKGNNDSLSRRDQLAAAAMQGLILANTGKKVSSHEMAETAVKQADLLITVLDRKRKE